MDDVVRRSRAASLLSGAILGAIVLIACRDKDLVVTDAPPQPSARAAIVAPASEFHEDSFDLVMRPAGDMAGGQPAVVEVRLSAKGEYHTNDKYPYKFRAVDSAGVKYAAPIFTKDHVELDEKNATLRVGFTPESAGQKLVGGQFSFSVCSRERCLVEKRDLALSVAVR